MAISGFTRVCANNIGGGVALYIANAADVTSMTKGTGVESYASITMGTGTVFYQYQFEQDSAQMTVNAEGDGPGKAITNQVICDLGKLTQLQRDEIQQIIASNSCGYVVIFKDANGTQWVFGYDELDTTERNMKLLTHAFDSKATFSEEPDSILTLQSIQRELPRTYTGAVPTT